MPVIIAENDISQWEDKTGVIYHFPKRYKTLLKQGTKVVYYKGRIKDKAFAAARLSSEPHYFGMARIGMVYADIKSDKGDLYALIDDFAPFEKAVPAKIDGQYLETITSNRTSNYWRDGVRLISQSDYDAILSRAKPLAMEELAEELDPLAFESANEGSRTSYFGTRYERQKDLRLRAIEFHGLDCKACGFDFEKAYGEYAKGFIHVHHVVPISTYGGEKAVNPETDLVTLCANCHAVVHRKRDVTLSIEQLKEMLKRQ
jgi:5-methylcytosine-specific restriction protein A